ncbi:thioredoxin family protein [Flavobacteriales bacterium]|jgi:thiol-disulfide isomerase/thioredoxin|nr:thioredoxin family protein [Flavobacteriales bacterium]MDA9775891.1 thioredoxin family protein [Flavobacteriales bacterium]MDG1175106.1 thioredoxin family protein [Flavobacteriales bacterium]|tara:strand:- start:317 stop:901 length:585 start_codon:yes stop_codon:yes gene_type:complete
MTHLEKGISESLTYNDYRELVANLLGQNKSTTKNGDESLVGYSKLNNSRMKRLDKTFKLDEEVKQKVKTIENKVTWVVLTEGWCGDAAQNIPIINKIAEENENIELKLVLRDENPELINEFLTNGNQSIPKLIQIEDGKVTKKWGPRPSIATKMIADYKAEHGVVDAEIKKDLQLWYNKDKGLNTVDDIMELLF